MKSKAQDEKLGQSEENKNSVWHSDAQTRSLKQKEDKNWATVGHENRSFKKLDHEQRK